MKKIINIGIDEDTYKELSKVATSKENSVVNELSYALKKHIDTEVEKNQKLKESKQLLTEG